MKKVLFAIAALATCMTASAQLWVGGALKLGNQSNWNDDKSGTEWLINPTVGYALDDALEVGLGFAIGGTSKGDYSDFNFNIAPFARYTFLSEGDFSLFLEGQVSYGYSKVKDADKADWNFRFEIEPGVKYALTDNFSMVAKLGGIFFDHNNPAASPSAAKQNTFGLDFGTGLSLGLYYSF